MYLAGRDGPAPQGGVASNLSLDQIEQALKMAMGRYGGRR
jgi:hypothetical protein